MLFRSIDPAMCHIADIHSVETSREKPVTRKLLIAFGATLSAIAASAGLAILTSPGVIDVALLAALLASLAANAYFAMRISRFNSLLEYLDSQADREADLRGLIRFVAQILR